MKVENATFPENRMFKSPLSWFIWIRCHSPEYPAKSFKIEGREFINRLG